MKTLKFYKKFFNNSFMNKSVSIIFARMLTMFAQLNTKITSTLEVTLVQIFIIRSQLTQKGDMSAIFNILISVAILLSVQRSKIVCVHMLANLTVISSYS